MSFRFQKRVRVAPGVRLNVSKRGLSTSVGPRGASMTVGKRGLHGNVGLPGTGLSYRKKLNSKGRKNQTRKTPSPQKNDENIQVEWSDKKLDFQFRTKEGRFLNTEEEKQVRKAYKSSLRSIYQEKADEINDKTERLLGLHLRVFQPMSASQLELYALQAVKVSDPKPEKIEIKNNVINEFKNKMNLFETIKKWIPHYRKQFQRRVDEETESQFQSEMATYDQAVSESKKERALRSSLVKHVLESEHQAMEEWLALFLEELDFPLETDVDFTIPDEHTVYADIDLPNIEEVPLNKARLLKSGKIKVEEKSQRERREHYAHIVSGTALYLASFIFAHLPNVTHVILSGYNQALNPSTGHTDDIYIYSLQIERSRFYELNFDRLDPIASFDHFSPRMKATKTYIFKEITPYDLDETGG
ncbi:DUF4236 domain-containing protein [Alteribacter populi]|uniref:DUF4236 domain-containing protein n=1 Tax=Alteribacter populi TaxID=2011011 RepID=UPI000BBAC277|nr:DUF4236 domain-containing protein [Alteribacter populi]